ncbi:hypothetical protein F503_07191 [Ophiostoma piceae UAMH 11346]|uniref:Eisosome protein 1 n=1 Tax=Ophiostoma piceae (strain UAMH 11346) TaxID=1262450 RepID=S3D7L8_OPHP1|nr:hypothetical protein F503_07191 [Ophiostoma piceae UAMH 11346]
MPAPSTAQRPARRQGRHLPAEHSGRLVYADPRSLPSYPTVGVKLDCTNSAALQASQTKSPPAIYTRGPVNPASLKAATAAAAASAALSASPHPTQASQSAPVAESSEPPMSPRPAQRRHHQRKTSESNTFSATPSVSNMSTKAPVDTSTWGNSAATQAFRNSQISIAKNASAPPPKLIPEIAALGPQPSLRAAKGAMKTAPGPSLRPRHKSSSTSSLRHQKSLSSHYPDGVSAGQASSSAANALKAATAAAKASAGDRSSLYHDAGSIPYTTMGRQMYTSHPSIGPEHDDQAHEQMLHASAVAMAKRMYNPQAGGDSSVSGPGGTQGTTLQEAAYKLAQERLEKLHEKYGKDREFRDYYVDPNQGPVGGSSASASRRFSVRGRLRRRRSSSESEISDGRSVEIRNQMSQLSGKISASEDKKRQDRQNVLLAAQRNVKSQLHDIDERVYANSGRVPPATLSSWESKAHSVAQDRANAELSKYPRADQVDIGGGKFIPRNEVDKIATRNVQPVIDDMHEKQQAEYERQEIVRKEQDDRKADAILLKSRDKELKDLKKKLKQEEKEKKNAQKAEEKARKADAKAAKKRGEFMAGSSRETPKPVAAIIPEAPTHQSHHDENELEDTDSEVMTAPDTTSSIRETHDADPPSPTTEPEHTVLANESLSKTREPVSPVSPGSPLSPVSPEARTGWVAPAAIVTAAATIPAVVVSKGSISSPSAQAPSQADRNALTSSTVPSAPSASSAPSAPSYVVPASIALPPTPAALPEAPSTPFTEPRAAPAVPTTPPAAATSVAAPAESPISTPPAAPYSIAAVSANKAAPATTYSPPASPFNATGTSTSRATEYTQEPRSGRRLSNLFVKTSSKDDAPSKPIEYDEVDHDNRNKATLVGGAGAFGAAGAVGADVASRTKASINPGNSLSSSPAKLTSGSRVETGATAKSQPISPKSDGSSSPKSKSKMRTWFKSKFSKPSSTSATSGTDAVQTGRDTKDTTYRAAGADINARKTFVGGHALTSSENVSSKDSPGGTGDGASSTQGMKGNISPAIGSGGLSLPAISGISGGFAAGTTAAATAAASRVSDAGNLPATKAADTGKSVASSAPSLPDTGVSTEANNGLNPGLLDLTGKSKTGGMYVSGSSSHRKPVATETDAKDKSVTTSPDDKPLSTETTSNVSASSDAPATKAANTSDTTVKTAGGPAAKQATKPGLLEPFASVPGKSTGSLGPLTPETRGPTNFSNGVTGDKAAGSSLAGGVSGIKGAATGVAAAATGAAVGGFSYATIVGGVKKDSTSVNETGSSGKKTFTVPSHSNAPGNRASNASYASSNYTSDGTTTTGTRGVSGSGFGLVGTNIFANIIKTGTLADVKDTNTYVTVPPPATAPSTGTAGTTSGESGIDAAYTPPRTLRDPADKKNASPVRDSRFLENLEDQF